MELGGPFSSEFKVIEKLGEGSFAEVFKVKAPQSQQYLAVKRLKKRYRSRDEIDKMPEIMTLQALQGHPNIVKLYDVIFDASSGYVAMVFELLDMNLYELIRDSKKCMDENTALLYIYQLLKAIAFMHSKNMFHRDIKPENCMVNKQTLELKLVDFGSARVTCDSGTSYTEYVSTRWYRAPECILTNGSYGPQVDIWAVGCILFEVLTSRPLFPGKHELDQITRIHNIVGTPSNYVLSQFRSNPNTQISFSFPQRNPQDLRKILPNATPETVDLMRQLLIYDPRDRVSAADALRHSAFATMREADLRWQNAGCPGPFPIFYKKLMASPPIPNPMYGESKPKVGTPPKAKPNIYYENEDEENEDNFVIQNHKIAIPPPPPKQQLPPLIQQKPPEFNKPQNKVNINSESLMESRKKAALRILEYNKKMTQIQNQPKAQLPQIQLAMGKPHMGSINHGVFQKPKLEIVQPRLPSLLPHPYVFK